MKLDLGTQSFMQKYVYNLQPNYIQCSNVKNYSVKVFLFLCDELLRQGSKTLTSHRNRDTLTP